MALAGRLRGEPGVREAAVLMGTPANQAILAAAGLAAPETADARPGDLIIAVQAESEAAAEAALHAAGAMLESAAARRASCAGRGRSRLRWAIGRTPISR